MFTVWNEVNKRPPNPYPFKFPSPLLFLLSSADCMHFCVFALIFHIVFYTDCRSLAKCICSTKMYPPNDADVSEDGDMDKCTRSTQKVNQAPKNNKTMGPKTH